MKNQSEAMHIEIGRSIKWVIDGSRYSRADVQAHIGLTSDQLMRRLNGLTPFVFHEVIGICRLLGVQISDILEGLDKTKGEHVASSVFEWRRQNLLKKVATIEFDEGIPRCEVAKRIGYSASWISCALGGKKPITSQGAKKIEYALGLPDGYLDNNPDAMKDTAGFDKDLFMKAAKDVIGTVEAGGGKIHKRELQASLVAICQQYATRILPETTKELDAQNLRENVSQLNMYLQLGED